MYPEDPVRAIEYTHGLFRPVLSRSQNGTAGVAAAAGSSVRAPVRRKPSTPATGVSDVAPGSRRVGPGASARATLEVLKASDRSITTRRTRIRGISVMRMAFLARVRGT